MKKLLSFILTLSLLLSLASCAREEAYVPLSACVKRPSGIALSLDVVSNVPADALDATYIRVGVKIEQNVTDASLTIKADGFIVADGAGNIARDELTVTFSDEEIASGAYHSQDDSTSEESVSRYLLFSLQADSLTFTGGTITVGLSGIGTHDSDTVRRRRGGPSFSAYAYSDGKKIVFGTNEENAKAILEAWYDEH